MPDEPDARAVASKVYELRTARGMTQKELGDAVGVTASRISQLELRPGRAPGQELRMPPDELLLRLAAALGDDVLRAARWGEFAEPSSMQRDASVALWRIRIDVLRDPTVMNTPEEGRKRALRLADELEAAACRAPESRTHVRNGRLDGFRRIVADVPDGARMILAVEALGMVIDAPVHVVRDNGRVRARRAVVRLFEGVGLDADRARTVLEGSAPRPLWDWAGRRPQCAGGALGQLEALLSGDPAALLLRGLDPSGWMGWPMMAGMWQVRPRIDGGAADRPSAGVAVAGELVLSGGTGIPWLRQRPIADDAVQRMDGSGLAPGPSTEWLQECEPELRPQLLTAHALGRGWVRQHGNRLVALYDGFPPLVDGDESAGIPAKRDAGLAVAALRDAAKRIYRWEHARSGAPRLNPHDFNEVLRDWADMEKTWRLTAERLKVS